ncbi:probable inactive receptor kinase At4g23740 [Prosopis cineraria]|uniref:probable inactive receptor kinase At4g23740 n=1 Tax=Prosopis cineraria TaxID=364024 RepID=UPI00240F5123|nr:probable inactive receptor kinase At4g23740 [Prosopis cineraria]XP_054788509.1 probable inactive receptor kinase At4g23740 [Prosopis cineraria]XP_054788510.1 probable inactive receptor kinase At4g23740 [Prosopis cineraria]
MGNRPEWLFMFSTAFTIGAVFFRARAEPVEDKQALLDFLHNINHSLALRWDENSSVCNSWRGITCNRDHSRVIALYLSAVGLSGPIPTNTLSRLSALETVNLTSNSITGPFPSGFSELKNLTYLYIQFNDFSGPLPSDFSVWKNLAVADLSNNFFNGSIPPSISNLIHLTSLVLANNSLSGEIPDINIPTLLELNLANNNLSGMVPKSLLRFPSRAFSGNNLTLANARPRKKTSKRFGKSALLGVILGGSGLAFALIAAFLLLCYCDGGGENGLALKSQKKDRFLKKDISQSHCRKNKIEFFEDCNFAFDLEDLLRASAEVLGKGTYGTTYKANIEDSAVVVVKRLKEVIIGKREFEQQMEVVGRIRHDNVAALRAYYYSKEEKLMIYDYYEQSSVSAMLHGKRGEERISLDWNSRLGIAIGAARGLAHVHAQQGGRLVHGNIKASNIFLNSDGYGCISDIGLATLMGTIMPPSLRSAGYRAPEVTDLRKASHASDVYSFGVLLLELLTGKCPMHATGSEEAIHLVRWVNSVVREEWTAEVFDAQLLRFPSTEEKMVQMLQLAMACVARVPEQRPKMPDVLRMMEEIRRPGSENQLWSESRSAASTPTPQATDVPSFSVDA